MKYLVLTFVFVTTLFVAACGDKGGGVASAPPPAPGLLPGPGQGNCQAGQVYHQQYGYLPTQNCPQGQGWAQQINQCVAGQAMTFQSCYGQQASARWAATLLNINRDQFELLGKYAGVCDPYWVGYNFGNWSCEYWSKQGFIVIEAASTSTTGEANITIGMGASSPYGSAFYYGGNTYKTISMRGIIRPINTNQGFELIGSNYAGKDFGVRGVVNTGTLADNSFTIELFYQGVKFAQTTVQRW